MLSSEDEILMKKLWDCRRFSSRILVTEFPNKNLRRRTLDHFLWKLRQAASIERNLEAVDHDSLDSRPADNTALSRNLVTWNVMQLWCYQVIEHVDCRIFIPVSTGTKKNRKNRSRNATVRIEN